ncbi:hypothetical protein N3K66_000163 [Trichothecium roseum]|uniref:Uncharacterized protein n=1 Tax=Trichothecium roseum TaxID=47278 RepID=A0ACC0VBF8_9HYPO|nr:hypothetical protein N3K66_000163 [Trichothecium roseum]
MGCTNSTPGVGGSGPRSSQSGHLTSSNVPAHSYRRDLEWSKFIEETWEHAVDNDQRAEFVAFYNKFMDGYALYWLTWNEPACFMAGTIVNLSELPLATSYGPCKYPIRTYLTFDDDFRRLILSLTIVICAPLEEGDNHPPLFTPRTPSKTPEMIGAMEQLPMMLRGMQSQGFNVAHARMNAIMGTDHAYCYYSPTTTEPTIGRVTVDGDNEFKRRNDNLVKIIKKGQKKKGQKEGLPSFSSLIFDLVISGAAKDFPDSGIWDEGEFTMYVKGIPYPHATRLLSARVYRDIPEDIDKTIFSAESPAFDTNAEPKEIMRNNDPAKDPGGLVGLFLIITDPAAVWPKPGDFSKHPALKAAEDALVDKMKKLHAIGKLRKCTARIFMGADSRKYKLYGNRVNSTTPKDQVAREAALTEKPASGNLDVFDVTLKKQQKHQLWDSESHFQAIRQRIQKRAEQKPEFANQMAPVISTRAAQLILRMNFPECEVLDAGEFPAVMPDGTVTGITDTRLILARDPKQEPNRIVAAVHVVPCPKPGLGWEAVKQTWLDTPEMRNAENALLEVLKKMYAEGKLSEVDCMAQVMMGTDISIYQFVEGTRFVDYSEERMAQFQFG